MGGVGTLSGRHQIRDPVHNFVELWEKEIKLVGTPLFQRLRGIRQLAMANLVYPERCTPDSIIVSASATSPGCLRGNSG